MIPKLELDQLLDKIRNFIRDLLCSIGEEIDETLSGNNDGIESVKGLTDAFKSTGGGFIDGVKGMGDDVGGILDQAKDLF